MLCQLYINNENPQSVKEIKKVGENICCLIEISKEDVKPDFQDDKEDNQVYKEFDDEFENFSSKKGNLLGFIDFDEEEIINKNEGLEKLATSNNEEEMQISNLHPIYKPEKIVC